MTAVSAGLLGQHTPRQQESGEGARLYQAMCLRCHGPDGQSIPGINLGAGEFTRPLSDSDLVRIVKEGIPGTPMTGAKLSDPEAASVVAFLHEMQSADERGSISGDVARGKELFEGKGDCLACHKVRGRPGSGGGIEVRGPSLRRISRIRTPEDLARSIMEPNAEVLYSYRRFRATRRDGSTIVARVLNEDTFSVQVVSEGRLMSLTKSDLAHYEFLSQSAMPSYRDKLSPQELADVVAYIRSL